jgi:hypothetical protein
MSRLFFNFEDIRKLNQGYEERVGEPDAAASALGHVVVGFSWLEDSLAGHISTLSGLRTDLAPALTAEMSFKNKVAALSSLVKLRCMSQNPDEDLETNNDMWKDIVGMVFTAEAMRNTLLHSHWTLPGQKSLKRTKITAKASQGIRIKSEDHDAGYILDVYDYILNVMMILDEFIIGGTLMFHSCHVVGAESGTESSVADS